MTDITLKIVLEAIKLTKGFDKNFLDSELAKNLTINKEKLHEYLRTPLLESLFRKTQIKRIKCPLCGKETERFLNINPICKECGNTFEKSQIGDYQLNLLKEQSTDFLFKQLVSNFENTGYTIGKSQKSIHSLSKDETRLFMMINLQNLSISDFFLLKGSINPKTFDFFIFIGFSADSELVTMSNQDPHCLFLSIIDLENADFFISLLQSIESRRLAIYENLKAEEIAGFKFEDYSELLQAKTRIIQIFDNLPLLALQQSEGSCSSQGKRFQKDVISLLNFTLFNAKYLGGKNEPDGLIQLFSIGKTPIWIPVEIKTFEPNEGNVLDIKEISSQLSKYSTALEKEDISCRISTPAFLTIAYNFYLDSDDQSEIINELERNHRIKYSFMPLNALTHLVKMFIDTQVSIIQNDIIQDLFIQNRLITKEIIDDLFVKILKANEMDKTLLKNLRDQVKKQGL